MRRLLPFLLCPTLASAAPELAWPVDCTLGETCFIQQFLDQDPGPDATDFRCGPQTYDAHTGTDIALPDLAAQAAGVAVRAASAGVVRGTRDSLPDIAQGQPGAPDVTGVECGNGLVIDHGDGWETQYCHMARGSIAVAPGEMVVPGTFLGLIGLSGQTEFPHLHLAVRQNGQDIDPFDPADVASCSPDPAATLWADPPEVAAGGIASVGFADVIPDFAAIKAGTAAMPLTTDSPALVFWAQVFGGRAGDVVRVTITGPNGAVVDDADTLARTQARLFRAMGRRTPTGGWPAGDYTATVTLTRDGAAIDAQEAAITLTAP